LRLWTLHPRYLDAKGLVALWREGLLARAVLRGATRAYRNHPQLERFRSHASPLAAINTYLGAVAFEAEERGYLFDRRKIGPVRRNVALSATHGQIAYEWQHLLRKLRARNPELYARWRRDACPQAHPLFEIVQGGVESWERSQSTKRLVVARRRRRNTSTAHRI
jgi:Pyrimidine dimer DNA glycosylase